MPSRLLLAVVTLTVTLSAACNVSFGPTCEFDQANALIDEANKLSTDGEKIVAEVSDRYAANFSDAEKTCDCFRELAAQKEPLKKLEPQVETAQARLRDASAKLDEATRLNLPDWFKQYLSTISEMNRGASELAALHIQLVGNTYDPKITTPEDLEAMQRELQEKDAADNKRDEEFRTARNRIEAEHKDEFRKERLRRDAPPSEPPDDPDD